MANMLRKKLMERVKKVEMRLFQETLDSGQKLNLKQLKTLPKEYKA